MLLLKDWLKIPRYSKHVSSIWISKEEKKGEGFKHVDSTSFQVNWRRTNPTNPTNLITLAIRHPPTSVVWLDTGSQIASSILIKPGTRCFVFGYVVKSSIARQKPTLIEFGRERGGVCGYTPEINRAPVVTFSGISSTPPSLSQKKWPSSTFNTFAPLGFKDRSFPDRSTRDPTNSGHSSNAKEPSADFSPGDTSCDWRF